MNKSPLATLIELTEKDVDEAAKRLGIAIRHHGDTEQQLVLLEQYRGDYLDRMQQQLAQGLNVKQYMNFQAFIGKLDVAIDGQKKIIQDALYRVELARNHWQEHEKKRLSYNTLNDRALSQAHKTELKRDQKQTDEHATRNYFYKR
jgi:flagellar FliJ protein